MELMLSLKMALGFVLDKLRIFQRRLVYVNTGSNKEVKEKKGRYLSLLARETKCLGGTEMIIIYTKKWFCQESIGYTSRVTPVYPQSDPRVTQGNPQSDSRIAPE